MANLFIHFQSTLNLAPCTSVESNSRLDKLPLSGGFFSVADQWISN